MLKWGVIYIIIPIIMKVKGEFWVTTPPLDLVCTTGEYNGQFLQVFKLDSYGLNIHISLEEKGGRV